MKTKLGPFEEHEVKDYERRRYRGLDQRIVHARELKILTHYLKDIGLNKAFILDVPCGYGRFSKLLLDFDLSPVYSDISFHMVKYTLENSQRINSLQRRGLVADVKHGLPFKANSFSLLLCMRLFHHVHKEKDREDILSEFGRVSNKWIILSYYQLNLFHLIQRKLRRKFKKSPARIKMISREEFQKEAERAGLRVHKVIPLFKGLHSQHIVLLKGKKRP